MTVGQVKKVYKDMENKSCPIAEKLIKAGYQQLRCGYIKTAKKNNETVDYKQALPTQYWHLFHSYFKVGTINELPSNNKFTKRVVCGELIFWMAEVLDCVDKAELEALCNEIINNPIPDKTCTRGPNKDRHFYNRRKWNKAIQDLCFDKIVEKVEKEYAKLQEEQNNNPV